MISRLVVEKKEIKCNKIGCNKNGKIETHIGWFCSEGCIVKIQKNMFRALIGWELKINQ